MCWSKLLSVVCLKIQVSCNKAIGISRRGQNKKTNLHTCRRKNWLSFVIRWMKHRVSSVINWDWIVANLTDDRMTQIDARRFSVRQFFLNKSLNQCLKITQVKCASNIEGLKNRYNPPEKIEAIIQNIVASGILHDVDHNPQIASVIGGRLLLDIVTYCRWWFHPYQQNIVVSKRLFLKPHIFKA